MSSPIKPPGADGPTGPPGAEGPGGVGTPGSPEETAESFREVLEGTADGAAAEASQEACTAEGIQALAQDLRAGRIDSAQAVERLVQRTLASRAAETLPAAARAELESHIRAALQDDPTLAGLTKDLERES